MRVVPLLLLGLSAAACTKKPAPATSTAMTTAPQEVAITATDFAYQLPATPVHAGLTTFTLVNQGTEVHHATLVRLEDGKTVGDYMTALQSAGPPPAWGVPVGGPNAAPPGGEANTTLVLEPGSYAVVCFIPSPDGVPHMAKGMVLGLEVQPATGPVAALPAGDIQLTLLDYSFAFSQPPTAGTHTFTVTNQGKEVHEVVLVKLAPGMTAEQVGAWYMGGEKGPPPGMPVGGVAGMVPGQVENFSANLEPGTYGMLCFAPAPDGAPHFVHGMAVTFTVS